MLVRVAWRDRRDRPAIGSRTWIGNGSDRTTIAKSISPTTTSRCCQIRRATTPTRAGASEIRKTTIGYAKIDRRTTTTRAGRPRVGARGSGDSGCRGSGRADAAQAAPAAARAAPAKAAQDNATQADEPAAALLAFDELVDDDEGLAAELPFDDEPELPLLDDPPSDPLLPEVDVALDVDEVSLVEESLAGDGVADPLDLSARESVR